MTNITKLGLHICQNATIVDAMGQLIDSSILVLTICTCNLLIQIERYCNSCMFINFEEYQKRINNMAPDSQKITSRLTSTKHITFFYNKKLVLKKYATTEVKQDTKDVQRYRLK